LNGSRTMARANFGSASSYALRMDSRRSCSSVAVGAALSAVTASRSRPLWNLPS